MKFEPQTFFIGIIDLFSVLLPGALATALIRKAVEPKLFPTSANTDAMFQSYPDNTARWVIFLFASYLLGHFIFLLGSFLDDLIYDKLRKQAKDEETALLKTIKGLLEKVNQGEKNALLLEIANQTAQAVEASDTEQQSMLEKLRQFSDEIHQKQLTANQQEQKYLATLKNWWNPFNHWLRQLFSKSHEQEVKPEPTLLEEIHHELTRYFSNRKSLFRKFYRWLLKLMFAANPDLALNQALEIKSKYVPDVKDKATINLFQWAKAQLIIKCPEALAEVQRLEADSKFFRSLVVVFVILFVFLFYKMLRGSSGWEIALSCFLLSGLSFWRYVERRFKATQQAYWYIITLEGSAVSTSDKQST